jgi:hypothetical protein
MSADARVVMCDQLKAVGFSEVKMLREPATAPNAVEADPRAAA